MTTEVSQLITVEIRRAGRSESPFYIPMTGPATRPRRSLKHDDTFIVLDSHGDIGASAGGPDGLFNADTRYLARLELVLNDVQPLLLGSNLRDDNSALTVDLTNPDIYRTATDSCCRRTCCTSCARSFCGAAPPISGSALQNHGERPASFDLTLLFDNDFADLFEVRGERRPRRGIGSQPNCSVPPMSCSTITGSTAAFATTAPAFRSAADAACRQCGDLSSRAGAAAGHRRSSSRSPATSRSMQKPVPFFRGLLAHRREMRRRRPARPASKPRTTSSTRCCASRWPISTC